MGCGVANSRKTAIARNEPPGPGEVSAGERLQLFLDGILKPEDLLDDEVLKGQFVGKNMSWSGRPRERVPRSIQAMFRRELLYRMERKFEAHVSEAIDTVVEVMRDGEGATRTERDMGITITEKDGTQRLKAAGMIIDRVLGPVTKDINVHVEQTPWQQAVESGELLIDVQNPDVVIDVEVVEDDGQPRRRRSRRP